MKKMNVILKVVFFFLLLPVISMNMVNAQDSKQETNIQNLVDSHQFVFKAESVSPLRGGIRHLTSDYELKVSKDSVIADLPYFGRAYSAPLDPSKGGIQFTSANFQYNTLKRKKGGWNISIKPKDASGVEQLVLFIANSGSATLQVISTNRDAITFDGHIVPKT
jgi:Domain of unknown function (DUF4251)